MTPEIFVEVIKLVTIDGAVKGVSAQLNSPAGRAPSEKLKALSNWTLSLSEDDKSRIRSIIHMSAESAVYRFLSILDGLMAIEDTPDKGDLELYFVKDGKKTLLNNFNEEFLTSIFKHVDSA
jgi:hypothetical protein